uniref:Ferredoxin n=1 Tax=Rhodococcus aetherivorans TaxID=191292 RepID=Q8VQU4_9NOCA|nr:ferredoxin [Rhodococcus aetherivorans I24]
MALTKICSSGDLAPGEMLRFEKVQSRFWSVTWAESSSRLRTPAAMPIGHSQTGISRTTSWSAHSTGPSFACALARRRRSRPVCRCGPLWSNSRETTFSWTSRAE